MADPVHTIINISTSEPNDDALAVMRLSLVDWLSVGLAGVNEPVSRIVRQLASSEGGREQAAAFGGGRLPMRAAALVNGTTSHALDYDDTHFAHIGHPSVAVIPAALAVAEQQGATLDQFLRVALAGCEASIRFGVLFGRSHYQTGFHQTATAGAFGATLAAAIQMTSDTTVLHHALGLVSTRASGMKSQFGTMGKPYNAGIAASNGVEAAWLAASGFLSNPDAITGVNGFLPTHHTDMGLDQAPGFLMTSVSHKFHACCHGLHAALEALAELKPLEPQSIARIEVATHPRWLTVCNQLSPDTGLEVKFSYRAALAASLLGHDTAMLGTYTDQLACDLAVVALRDKVSVVADDALTEMQARVTVHSDTGADERFYDLDAELPMAVRSAKIRRKSEALLGGERAARIWEVVHTKNATPVSEVAQLLTL